MIKKEMSYKHEKEKLAIQKAQEHKNAIAKHEKSGVWRCCTAGCQPV